MKEVLYFYLEACPYCHQADELIEEIKKENAKYKNVVIRKVEESLNREFSDKFGYDYVPCMYVDGDKIIEGKNCTKENLIKMFDDVLGSKK